MKLDDKCHQLQKLSILGREMMDDVFIYLQNRSLDKVWEPMPADLKDRLDEQVPLNGMPPEKVYQDFKELILPYTRGNNHPNFWGWVNGSGLPVAALADFLCSALNNTVGSGDNAAMIVEQLVIDWLKCALNWPHQGSGLLTSGCSMGQIIALSAARQAKSRQDVRNFGNPTASPLRIYCSKETHHSLQKAVELIGIGSRNIKFIDVDNERRIKTSELVSAINDDIANGYHPFCVVGNVGTVNTGAIDNISDLRRICDRFNLWLHVDGAFGSAVAISSTYKDLVIFQNMADSIIMDLHKWMYIPFDASCILVRKKDDLLGAFNSSGAYMENIGFGPTAGPHNFSDMGIEQSRRFRALKVWFSLKTYGLAAFSDMITRNIEDVQAMITKVNSTPCLALGPVSPINVACFRFDPKHINASILNEINRRILELIWKKGRFMPSYTTIDGIFYIRVANVNHRTERADLLDFVELVAHHGSKILEAGADGTDGVSHR